MQDSEIDDLFERLTQVLFEAGLGWLVAQVRDEIAGGVIGVKSVSTSGTGEFTLAEADSSGSPPALINQCLPHLKLLASSHCP